VRTRRDNHSRRRYLAMNSNLWLRLARLVQDVQSISRKTFRTKMREEKEEHAMLLSFLLIMVGGGRSGGQCQCLAFGAPSQFGRLRRSNGNLIS
jgi:hypothetical protein